MKTTLLLLLSIAGLSTRGFGQPVITNQPQNQTAIAGSNATFTAGATGTPPLSYQWRSHANPTSFTNIPGATEATLLLTNVQPTQRRFAVVVCDAGGLCVTSSPLATLTVLVPPSITQPPTNQSIFPGGGATLRVTATGTAPLSYQWMFNSPTNPIPGATTATWIIPRLQSNQVGHYFVVITNAVGAVTSPPARLAFFWAPMTGTDIPALARLDTNMQSLLWRYGIPGGSLAVVKDGRLVFARGYGYADTNTGEVVQPDSLFRVGSNSKLITAAATMKLVEEGRLRLTNSAFGLLQYPTPTYAGSTNDPRLGSITVQHLLNHTAGWDRNIARKPDGGSPFDPAVWFQKPAQDLGLQSPLNTSNQVVWIMGLPLQFSPGTDFEYSNVGYQILGRVIEKVTGQPYEEYVRDVMRTIGVNRTRVSADSPETLHRGQVMNYDYPRVLGNPWVASLGDEVPPNDSPMPYSIRCSMFDAMGGWITSPIEYLRFVMAIDGRPSPPDMLSTASVNLMRTATVQSINGGLPYGLGWYVNLPGPGDFYHGGIVAGSRSMMFNFANGFTVMAVVNFFPYLDSTFEPSMETILTGIPGSTTAWPTNDFFATTLSYDAWRDQHFTAAELTDPAISGEGANPDGDGLVNLLEYAFGSDPKLANAGGQPTGSFVTVEGQQYFALTFRRLLLGYELNYVVEASNDLETWSPLTEAVGQPQLNNDGTLTVTLRDTVPANAASQRFLRLRVSRQ